MKNGYDHRYKAGRFRDTIVDLIRIQRSTLIDKLIEKQKPNE